MTITQSKITREGQATVPTEVRETPSIHEALFPTPPVARSLEELDEGVRSRMRRKYARD